MNSASSLKITDLHVHGLGGLRAVDWPADGMDWGSAVPDVVLVGGINGSGKTTLLEFIARAFECMIAVPDNIPPQLAAEEASMGVDVRWQGGEGRIRYVVGSPAWHLDRDAIGYVHDTSGPAHAFAPFAAIPRSPAREGLGRADSRLLYYPSNRGLVLFEEPYKSPGKLQDSGGLVHRWEAPSSFKQSLEALLYAARWEDLSAIAEGRPSPGRFNAFADAFAEFTDQERRLTWHNAELCVESRVEGVRHALGGLSDGEKQIILLTAELRYRWRPGSIVLIDEPELHLHPSWQARLWELLIALRKERGGQLIATTQSNYLFGIADPRSTTILGRASL